MKKLTHLNNKTMRIARRCIIKKVAGLIEVPTVINEVTGREWMAFNLGATKVAESIDDDEAFGDLYQWGRDKDGHEKRDSAITEIVSDDATPGHGNFIIGKSPYYNWINPELVYLWQSGINDPSPRGFRLPTEQEWLDEIDTWESKDLQGAFNSVLKLPAAGGRSWDGSLFGEGTFVDMWTKDFETATNDQMSVYGEVNQYTHGAYGYFRSTALPVRCIKI